MPTSIRNKEPEEQFRKQWLEDAKTFIDEDLLKRENQEDLLILIDNWREPDDANFSILFDRINNHFNNYIDPEDDINNLSNLALLDSSTNRSYKNAIFPLKRKTIIDRDKEGAFIPICTKNVFLKYFSNYPPKISFWTQEDRKNYENDLTNTLSKYIEN